MKKPNSNPNCKECGKPFKRYNTIQKHCVDCAISMQQGKLLVKGTEAFKKAKVEVKIGENRSALQNSINLLARMIDAKFGHVNCIDCNKPMLKQIHGAHYHDVGGNEQLRFNLTNIHSALSQCNKYSSDHKVGYKQGLIDRYGIDYFNEVEDLKTNIKELKLNATEIAEKLALVRKLIRTFDKFDFESSLIARKQFNTLIGIYQ